MRFAQQENATDEEPTGRRQIRRDRVFLDFLDRAAGEVAIADGDQVLLELFTMSLLTLSRTKRSSVAAATSSAVAATGAE